MKRIYRQPRRHTLKENLISVLIGVALFAVLALLLRPVYLKEKAERERIEREWVQEQIAKDRAYEAEVAAEKARWERIEAGLEENPMEMQKPHEEILITELTEEDLKEQDYFGELELLAQLVEAEAGNQDLTGKRLVVDVVLNRVDCELFPDTIEEVIKQPGQFSTWSNGMIDDAAWHMQQSDYDAVILELESRLDYDIYFFTAGAYNKSGTDAYIHMDHYFSYLGKEARALIAKNK